jgi:tRNA(His) guanylyltransferase
LQDNDTTGISTMKDDLGDRMKGYETVLSKKTVDKTLPVYMRLDGRSFSKFTRKLKLSKPRDDVFSELLITATKETMKEFGFIFGFSQSDEISLFFPTYDNPASELPFGGKIQKLTSVIPSYFTSVFLSEYNKAYQPVELPYVAFDNRIIEFPTKAEAVNMLVWRFQDARRNYITDTAHTLFSKKSLHKVTTAEMLEKIKEHQLIDTKLCATFLKPVMVEKPITNKFVGSIIVKRTEIQQISVDFENMSFTERMELIYG